MNHEISEQRIVHMQRLINRAKNDLNKLERTVFNLEVNNMDEFEQGMQSIGTKTKKISKDVRAVRKISQAALSDIQNNNNHNNHN